MPIPFLAGWYMTDLRMKYRYLDLRRNVVRESLQLRHKMAQQTRVYMDAQNFIEVETPVLIKSTPEGARDSVAVQSP